MTLQQTLDYFERMKTYEDNWDGFGMPKPTAQVIEVGRQFALRMERALSAAGLQYEYGSPSSSQYHEEPQRMEFEWWGKGKRSLTISLWEDLPTIEYMKAWPKENATSPADLEFEDGHVTDDTQIVELWKWLEAE